MDRAKRLIELCELTNSQPCKEPRTVSELIENCRKYRKAWEKLEALGPERLERIRSSQRVLLAEALQPHARRVTGKASPEAILSVIQEDWKQFIDAYWQKQQELYRELWHSLGLEPEIEAALNAITTDTPRIVLDFFASEAGELEQIPIENLGEVGTILAEMFRERKYDH
jgi:hypothetical protein